MRVRRHHSPPCPSSRTSNVGSLGALSFALLIVPVVTAALEPQARASENYPGIIESHTGVECPRPLTRCLICHDTAAGGEETANQPFARALVESYGLSGGKAGRELAMALEALPPDVDTDGDGAPDQEELTACGNPSGEELSEGPGYGCNASIAAPSRRGAAGVLCGTLIGGLLLAWRLRRSRVA